MPASIIGLPTLTGANAKVLETSDYQREMNGLETLTETYTVRSSNRITLAPLRNVTHSAFSTSDTKYPRLVVENVSFRDVSGSLTKMTVTFVGLTSSAGLPAPIVRILPVTGKVYIEAEYVTNESEDALTTLGNVSRMPAQINGYNMPPNPAQTVIASDRYGNRLTALGYCHDQAQCTRRGLFLVVRRTFRTKTFGIGIYSGATDL